MNDRERIEMKKYCRWERTPHRPQGDPLAPRGPTSADAGRHVTLWPAEVRPSHDRTDAGRLVARARDGDQAAFEELVRATYADTYTLA